MHFAELNNEEKSTLIFLQHWRIKFNIVFGNVAENTFPQWACESDHDKVWVSQL